jgi:hypothetical protein
MRAATPNDRALNCCATTVTWLTSALIDVESLLHLTIAIWCRVIVDRGATSRHRLTQHAYDRKVKSFNLRRAQPVRRGERMDLRAPERFVGVDVADPNDAALIE